MSNKIYLSTLTLCIHDKTFTMTKKNFLISLFVLFTVACFALKAQNPQIGLASYYGRRFHGRTTSSGIPFNMYGMMCAHRTLPFGTKIKVKNMSNDKEIIVTVTDRGPYISGRVLDLSFAAAKAIGMIQQGVTKVQITTLPEANCPYLNSKLPVLLFVDPQTGETCTLKQWKERNIEEKEQLRRKEIEQRQALFLAKIKEQEPRWTIFSEEQMALAQ